MDQPKTELALDGRTLELKRYPPQRQAANLQAWDAADEYIIRKAEEQGLSDQDKVLVFNDEFGALACAFSKADLHWYSDSKIAHIACAQNLARNGLTLTQAQLLPSLAQPANSPDWVLLKIPRTSALLEHQLTQLQSVIGPSTRVIASAKANQIQKSTLSLFERLIGTTTTSLAWKKARLIFAAPTTGLSTPLPAPLTWRHEGLTLINHANVFSRQQIDIGARFLLAHLPTVTDQSVVDLGCGNGVLGVAMLANDKPSRVHFVDESYMAVESARENVALNCKQTASKAEFHVNNCLEGFPSEAVDQVLCNPPFHQQNTVTDHIAWQMFSDARRVLKKGGHLVIVANRHLNYPNKLKRLFGGCKVLASNRKFVILTATKR